MRLFCKLILNFMILFIIFFTIMRSTKAHINGQKVTLEILGQEFVYISE